MLSDRDALLAAIRANPEEDTPRLVFADWLDENGQHDRAEFIRLQCEIARLDNDDSDSQSVYEFLRTRDYVTRPTADWTKIDDGIHRRVAYAVRARDLIKRHGEEWVPKLPKKYNRVWHKVTDPENKTESYYDFHRGFAHGVVLTDVPKVRAVAEQLRQAAPAVTLVASDFTSEFVDRLADVGLLSWITGLQLQGDVESGLRAFGRRPEAANVRSLRIEQGHPFDLAGVLASAPHWTGLRSLDLSRTAIDILGGGELFRVPHLRTLKRLAVGGRFGTTDAARALTENGFTELTTLRLTYCSFDDDAAEALAACPALSRLRELDLGNNEITGLGNNEITGRGVTALLCSPHLANLSYLGLEGNPCSGVDPKRLAATAPAGLRMLHCHGTRFRTSDVRALSRCPRLRTLWYLDLDANNLGTPAVRELIRGFKGFCPPIVWLTYNRIDDRGAELLANWKAATALRVLHLRYNGPMTDAGARALLDSPHLANLDGFGVSGASAETTERLCARFKHFDIRY